MIYAEILLDITYVLISLQSLDFTKKIVESWEVSDGTQHHFPFSFSDYSLKHYMIRYFSDPKSDSS